MFIGFHEKSGFVIEARRVMFGDPKLHMRVSDLSMFFSSIDQKISVATCHHDE
jgi:hypothetical protein